MRTDNTSNFGTSGALSVILVVIAVVALVVFQQSYARAHEIGVEQPIGLYGIAEYLFRHPEKLFDFN